MGHLEPMPNEQRTDGSQCLVGGAKGIRTAGPLCVPYVQERLVMREISTRPFPKKPHRELFSDSDSSHGPADNERIWNGLPEQKAQKGTGGSNPLIGRRIGEPRT